MSRAMVSSPRSSGGLPGEQLLVAHARDSHGQGCSSSSAVCRWVSLTWCWLSSAAAVSA